MQSLQDQVQELCQLADQVVANPLKSPVETAEQLHMSSTTIGVVCGTGIIANPIYIPILGVLFYAWRKYTESQKRKQEKERMLQEIIAKQQAVIRTLEAEEEKMKQENAQNREEVTHLKQMLDILEKVVNQVKTAA